MEYEQINELKPHPLNTEIYGDTFDDALMLSIKDNGMGSPILITGDGTIISGHRRWNACKALKMDMIPVEIIEETDPDKYTELLIAHNVQREKANEMNASE